MNEQEIPEELWAQEPPVEQEDGLIKQGPVPEHTEPYVWKEEDSNLMKHAKEELTLAGLFDKDADYGGAIAPAVMDIMRVFASQGHSGFSAGLTLDLFTRLARFQNLTPLKIEDFIEVGTDAWQCKRCSEMFLTEDKTGYYSVDNPGVVHKFEVEKLKRSKNEYS